MSDTAGSTSAILRDYLYVDVDKVKSIAGQLEEGVPEEARLTKKDGKKTSVGWEKFLNYSPESSEEDYIQRSMLDSLFPDLEEMLEDGWPEDVSDLFYFTHSLRQGRSLQFVAPTRTSASSTHCRLQLPHRGANEQARRPAQGLSRS